MRTPADEGIEAARTEASEAGQRRGDYEQVGLRDTETGHVMWTPPYENAVRYVRSYRGAYAYGVEYEGGHVDWLGGEAQAFGDGVDVVTEAT